MLFSLILVVLLVGAAIIFSLSAHTRAGRHKRWVAKTKNRPAPLGRGLMIVIALALTICMVAVVALLDFFSG